MITINIKLNGKKRTLNVSKTDLLVDVLRNKLGLGVKKACGEGECGSCTVIINGKAVNSCLILAATMDGADITTIEGIGQYPDLHPIQEAFVEEAAVQCGYCTPGMVLSAKALLDENPNPTETEIREAISGNLCRCTGYHKIVKAISKAAESMDKKNV